MYALLDQLDSKINKCINIKCKFNGYFIVISWGFQWIFHGMAVLVFSWYYHGSCYFMVANFMTFSYTGDTMNFKKFP